MQKINKISYEQAIKNHSWEERLAQLEARKRRTEKAKEEAIDVREFVKQFE